MEELEKIKDQYENLEIKKLPLKLQLFKKIKSPYKNLAVLSVQKIQLRNVVQRKNLKPKMLNYLKLNRTLTLPIHNPLRMTLALH